MKSFPVPLSLARKWPKAAMPATWPQKKAMICIGEEQTSETPEHFVSDYKVLHVSQYVIEGPRGPSSRVD